MKKLMIAASAALCATVGFSDVTSANVVGYQNKDVGAFSLVGTTFKTLGCEEADMTLGAISANSVMKTNGRYDKGWNWSLSYITFFDADGEAGPNLAYLPEAVRVKKGIENPSGWYRFSDVGYEECLNDVQPCTLGDGFVVFGNTTGTDTDPQLIFNGEVKGGRTDIPVGAFTLAANCTPTTMTLGDLTANSVMKTNGRYDKGWNWSLSYITFFDPVTGEAGSNLAYLPEAVRVKKGIENPSGWYKFSDVGYEECLNSQEIPAGTGFVVFGNTTGTDTDPVLTFPSAITAE